MPPTPSPEPQSLAAVLLVSDQVEARRLIAGLLEAAGLRVAQAHDGEAALSRFLQAPHEFRLVLLDLAAPRQADARALAALRTRRPDVPMILLSNDPPAVVAAQFAGLGIDGYLGKNVRPCDLVALVRSIVR